MFALFAAALVAAHTSLLRLPYFWDEAGYYVPAARDLLAGSLIPFSTPSNAHPPLVMAWIALSWKCFGFSPLVTRVAMLLLAAFSLLGFFRLARTVSNTTVAGAATLLTAVYPVFFAQSSLAQVDLPAAGLIFWALHSYFRRRWTGTLVWFSLAALAKETAILVPIALFLWHFSVYLCALCGYRLSWAPSRTRPLAREFKPEALLLIPILPLAVWYAYHYTRTGFVFGNPEFFRYNVQGTLHPLRIFLAALLRVWQAVGYMNLFVLTIACAIAMRHSPKDKDKDKDDSAGQKQRIAIPTQLTFLAIAVFYGGALSVIGGAVLARYMLPVVPLVILVCVSTIWRRLKLWPAMIAFNALAFVQALFVNPPYGFAPEDNLAYRDYIRLHQQADAFLVTHYPNSRVLTAWPASGELTQPFLGYVEHPLPVDQIVQIEDFTAESLLSAKGARFDVALVFSTKYQPPPNLFDRWQLWQQWKARYFGFHRDLTPEAATSVLGGKLVYVKYSSERGQWVGIVEMAKVEDPTKLAHASADVPSGQKVLDLRVVPNSERHSLGVPGSSVSSELGKPTTTSSGYRLPFLVKLHSLVTQQGGKKMTVEIELLNVTVSKTNVPSCLDETMAHGAGTKDRRSLGFGLLFQTDKREIRQLMAVTFDSAANPDCSVRLDPSGTLLVIDEIQVPDEVLTSNGNVTAKAFVEEWKLEDGRYFVTARSERAESNPREVPR